MMGSDLVDIKFYLGLCFMLPLWSGVGGGECKMD